MARTLKRLISPVEATLRLHPAVTTCNRHIAFLNGKFEYDRDFITKMQQPYDLTLKGFIKRQEKRTEQKLIEAHTYNPELHAHLGPDLAAAHLIVAHGGAVKFMDSDIWVQLAPGSKRVPLPGIRNRHMKLEAVDASNTNIMYQSLGNFKHLDHFKYLRVSNCINVNDWFLDALVECRDTLEVLDLSGCPGVTERGLATLHRFKNLRSLVIEDMPSVKNKGLVAILLEESMPHCIIHGIDYTDTDTYLQDEEPLPVPKFIGNAQTFLLENSDIEEDELADQKLLPEGETSSNEQLLENTSPELLEEGKKSSSLQT